ETAAKFGEKQVLTWRRSYDIPPPALERGDPRDSLDDPRYADIARAELPLTECLKDTVARFLPYWNGTIAPAVRAGRKVLIVAHGNSLRALVKYLDEVSDGAIVELNIPTGLPLVYELDSDLRPLKHYYLGDPAEAEARARAAADQGKAGRGRSRAGSVWGSSSYRCWRWRRVKPRGSRRSGPSSRGCARRSPSPKR